MQGGVRRTYILVRDDLHTEHVAAGLENLLEDVLSHSRIQSSNVESSLVGLWSRSADISSGAGGGQHGAP